MKFLLAIIVLLAAGCSSRAENDAARTANAGNGAPPAESAGAQLPGGGPWPAELADLDGTEFRPADDASLKAVVLVFVLQDCPIANSYLPKLNDLAEKFGERGVRMFVVQTDRSLDAAAAKKHQTEYEIRPAVVLDTDHRWVKFAGATKTPEAAVFLPDGTLVYRGRIDNRYAELGKKRTEATEHNLRVTLEAVLAGNTIKPAQTEVVGCYIPE